jgi:hypothetical protein
VHERTKRLPRTHRGPLLLKEKLLEIPSHTNTLISGNGLPQEVAFAEIRATIRVEL